MHRTTPHLLLAAACLATACSDGIAPRTTVEVSAPLADVVAMASAGELFFTEAGNGKIWRATLDASGTLTSAMPILQRTAPVALAVDAPRGKLYWTDIGTNTIERALVTPPFTVDPPVLSGLGGPLGIAIDGVAQRMYWVEEAAREIHSASVLNGSGDQTLVAGLGDPRYITLDGAGRMYWTDATRDEIARARTDGTQRQTFLPGLVGPYGILFDRPNKQLYWGDNSLGTIQTATPAGSRPPIVTGTPSVGIALDRAAGKIYWAANASGKIQRANLDGSGVEDLVTGLSNPHGILLRQGSPVIPSCTVKATGSDVWVRFASGDPSLNSDAHWYAVVNGVAQQFLFNSVTGVPGTELKINHVFAPGDEVAIGLLVNTTGFKYWTGPAARNPDGVLHFRGVPVVNDVKYQVRGRFEASFGGGDNDFDDLVIDLGGVQCS